MLKAVTVHSRSYMVTLIRLLRNIMSSITASSVVINSYTILSSIVSVVDSISLLVVENHHCGFRLNTSRSTTSEIFCIRRVLKKKLRAE
jgi:hypothetical protein